MLFSVVIFLICLIVAYLLSKKVNLQNLLYLIPRKRGETTSSKILENRKYLYGTFEDGDAVYDFYVPYNKRLGMRNIKIKGSTSGKLYRFHPAVIPAVKARDFQEESWIVTIDDVEEKILITLDNFSC